MRFTFLSVFALAGSSLVRADDSSSKNNAPDDFGILEWIHNTEGGFYNPKQDFRRSDPSVPNSVSGIFANDRIEKDEVLCQVPWEYLIKSDDPTEEGQMCCGTVRSVAREMRFNDTSHYKPYAMYLNAQAEDQLPSAWSEKGQELLRAIIGGTVNDPEIPPVEPTEWLTFDWFERCKGNPEDKLTSKAAMMVVQRSDDFLMIPAYDFYNHRNGKYYNSETTTKNGEHHVTRATRVIEAGEQVYASYNMCRECVGRSTGYGTGEMLRDYGFVELYPQRWHYMSESVQFDLDEEENGELVVDWHSRLKPSDDERQSAKVWFHRQIRRLRRVKNIDYRHGNPGIASHEWDVAFQFADANILAMTAALQSLEKMGSEQEQTCAAEDTDACRPASTKTNVTKLHYDSLEFEIDDLDYISPTCDNDEIMMFHEYDVIHQQRTQYQQLNFAYIEKDDDVCMDLDDIVQICSCYRPQYHEYVVHAAARYVETVKRVIFIGGGDSMLLHEVLKYPSLELVVGLELDQVVARQSFKYFQTQPHFDDDRVEWWFGDATKSLLLLPEDYWGSFDLVLVDLSETVMSLSVTGELDVFDALTLLLKPEGVMVKNELYMDPFSKLFDYTIQMYYPSPVICSQALALGSNTVDFLHFEPKDHKVETLLYEPLVTSENRFDFLHDYRKNDARSQGKCGELPKRDTGKVQGRSAGIFEVVEAEQTTVTLDKTLTDKLLAVVQKLGFSPVTVPSFDNGVALVKMKEGYVLARMWPEHNYVGFDINLWGTFHKIKSLRQGLLETVGSSLVSSYRVVVGGMYGSSTWKEDQKITGPQIVQKRNCEIKAAPMESATAEQMIATALDESVNLSHNEGLTVVVICGTDKTCLAAELLSKRDNIIKMLKLKTCSGLDETDEETKAIKMYECEQLQVQTLGKALGEVYIDVFVMDSSVPYEMIQIWNSILSVQSHRDEWIQEHNIFIACSTNPSEEPWRQQFLDRYRKQHEKDPIAHSTLMLQSGDNSVEIGLVSAGDDMIAYNAEMVESNLKERFDESKLKVDVELLAIQGGLFHFDDVFEPRKFLQSDYDNEPGLNQYSEQKPFGHQIIFQMEPANDEDPKLTTDGINSAFDKALAHIQFKVTSHHLIKDIGDGAMMVYIGPQGHAIIIWDGRQHIDINLYTEDNNPGAPENFIGAFLHFTNRELRVALRDDQPRGVGRVINFRSDIDDDKKDDE